MAMSVLSLVLIIMCVLSAEVWSKSDTAASKQKGGEVGLMEWGKGLTRLRSRERLLEAGISRTNSPPFVTPDWAKITTHPNGSWICDRPWPQLEMFMPMALHHSTHDTRYYEYETLFLRSTAIFWRLEHVNASLRLMFDEELISVKRNVYNMIVDTFRPFAKRWTGGMHFTASPPSPYYSNGGVRQQLMMFWADNFTTSEYVAFVDSDCVFLTYIDREDLFEDGKPVVNGRSGPPSDSAWANAPGATWNFLGVNEPMRCMSYFPVIIKTSHLRDLREYVVQQHGGFATFDEVFRNETRYGSAFQFNVMCTYLFYFKANEYKFYAHPTASLSWDGLNPPMAPHSTDYSVFKGLPDVFEPKPRVATHSRYRGWKSKYMMNIGANRQHMNLLLQQGICLSPPIVYNSSNYVVTYPHRDDPVCENITYAQKPGMNGLHTVQELGYYEEMHIFEFQDWTNVFDTKTLQDTFQSRTHRFAHCDLRVDAGEYSNIMKHPWEMANGGWRR